MGPLDTRHGAPVLPPCSEPWRPPVPPPAAPHEPSSGNPEAPRVLRPPVACSPGLLIAVFVLPAPGPTQALLQAGIPAGTGVAWQEAAGARVVRAGEVPAPGPIGKAGAQSSGWWGAPFGGRCSGDMGCWPSCRRRAGPGAGPGLWCCPTRAWRAGPGQRVQNLVLLLLCQERQAPGSCRDFPQAPRGSSRVEGSSQILCWPGPALLQKRLDGAGLSDGRLMRSWLRVPAAAACGRPLAHLCPTCLFTVWPCLGGTRGPGTSWCPGKHST